MRDNIIKDFRMQSFGLVDNATNYSQGNIKYKWFANYLLLWELKETWSSTFWNPITWTRQLKYDQNSQKGQFK